MGVVFVFVLFLVYCHVYLLLHCCSQLMSLLIVYLILNQDKLRLEELYYSGAHMTNFKSNDVQG
jgi:hypothetical protein